MTKFFRNPERRLPVNNIYPQLNFDVNCWGNWKILWQASKTVYTHSHKLYFYIVFKNLSIYSCKNFDAMKYNAMKIKIRIAIHFLPSVMSIPSVNITFLNKTIIIEPSTTQSNQKAPPIPHVYIILFAFSQLFHLKKRERKHPKLP